MAVRQGPVPAARVRRRRPAGCRKSGGQGRCQLGVLGVSEAGSYLGLWGWVVSREQVT